MERRYHVALVTSAQPSANPRLVKEAKSLLQAGYFVTVIWCPISPWADDFDQKLFDDLQEINWVKAGYHYKYQPFGYWYARIRQKIWQFTYKIFYNCFDASIKSQVLFSQEIENLAVTQKADIYIGHNLGALPAIVKASKKFKSKSIFDFEDFHRGEFDDKSNQVKKIKHIENKYIPLITSITTASPLITQAYKDIFSNLSIKTINNCFPISYALDQLCDLQIKPLQLFWFSQYIGKERGLETVIESMSRFSNKEITLTLLGTVSNEIKIYFLSLSQKFNLNMKQIIFLDPVSEKDIVQIASKHHIGLASEYSHNVNRNQCLTNKIFIYLLAGNALVLSNTQAQKDFLNENPNIGSMYEQNSVEELTSVLKSYLADPQLLLSHRLNALELAKRKYNWEIEKHQFLENVKSVLLS
jgi:glycosyltransferase involved in cell wall biosynthesis